MTFATYVECEVPRTDCAEHDVHQIQTPWAEPGGRFTLDFETFAIQLILACQNLTQGRDEAAAQAVAADMWIPYRNAVACQLPNAVLVHDRFHIMGYLTKVLDKVRRKEHWELKASGNHSLSGTK